VAPFGERHAVAGQGLRQGADVARIDALPQAVFSLAELFSIVDERAGPGYQKGLAPRHLPVGFVPPPRLIDSR
jgi:hypothetical protein